MGAPPGDLDVVRGTGVGLAPARLLVEFLGARVLGEDVEVGGRRAARAVSLFERARASKAPRQ